MKHNEQIAEATADLMALLDDVVPRTTVHYAVEEARRALRVLNRFSSSGSILTKDKE